ncbi:MAG: ABC transporter ATP-binding protein, partial [Acidobacteria bacterium]|nr:ABC transporter ATP-binding protein [Acidobacteriota bacterium]
PPVITPDIEELLADTGQTASSLGDTSKFVARVSPDARVRRGESIDLIVDTAKLHFFDSSSGDRIGAKHSASAGT